MARHPALTAEQRMAIVRQSDKQPEWKQKRLGQWAADTFELAFVPSQPTISIILRQSGKTTKVRAPPKTAAKPKVIKCPEMERRMLQWLEKQIDKDEAVTVTSVTSKAQELVHQLQVLVDGFVVSDSWVDSFMKRHVLRCPFELSNTDSEGPDEDILAYTAVATKKTASSGETEASKAGKTSRRVVKNVVAKKDSPIPTRAKVSAPPAGKRKRDSKEREPAGQVRPRR